MKLKIGKFNTKLKFKNTFFQKPNSTISLPVKLEVYEKSTFLSLCLAKRTVKYNVLLIRVSQLSVHPIPLHWPG